MPVRIEQGVKRSPLLQLLSMALGAAMAQFTTCIATAWWKDCSWRNVHSSLLHSRTNAKSVHTHVPLCMYHLLIAIVLANVDALLFV